MKRRLLAGSLYAGCTRRVAIPRFPGFPVESPFSAKRSRRCRFAIPHLRRAPPRFQTRAMSGFVCKIERASERMEGASNRPREIRNVLLESLDDDESPS